MKKQRVEKHIIKENNKYYEMLDGFCYKSKNLYNFANYHIRKQFIDTRKWLRYCDLDKLMKQSEMDFDYRSLPVIQSSQQCLKLLDKNWKSFFKAIKDWNKNKSKYNVIKNYQGKKYTDMAAYYYWNKVRDNCMVNRKIQGFMTEVFETLGANGEKYTINSKYLRSVYDKYTKKKEKEDKNEENSEKNRN